MSKVIRLLLAMMALSCLLWGLLTGCMGMSERKGSPKLNAYFKSARESALLSREILQQWEKWNRLDGSSQSPKSIMKRRIAFEDTARKWLRVSGQVKDVGEDLLRAFEAEGQEIYTPYLQEEHADRLEKVRECHDSMTQSMDLLRQSIGEKSKIVILTDEPEEGTRTENKMESLKSAVEKYLVDLNQLSQIIIQTEFD